MTRLSLLLLAACCISSAADIVADFPSSNINPNGQWSYGYVSSLGGTFQLFTSGYSDSVCPVGCGDGNGWNPVNYLQLYHPNQNRQDGSVLLDTAFLNMHPGNNGFEPVVRWTAPADGTWDIQGAFAIKDTNPSGVRSYILLNGDLSMPFLKADLGSSRRLLSFSGTYTFAAGDTLDFTIDQLASLSNDTTGIQGTITLVDSAEVPEPSTFGLLFLAGGGLALADRRRRSRRLAAVHRTNCTAAAFDLTCSGLLQPGITVVTTCGRKHHASAH